MSVTENRLRKLVAAAPSSLEDLVQLLLEGLDWPIPQGMDLGDVPLDWSLDELHLDPKRVATLRAIRQIPKLVDEQRFGVFVLDFDGGTLPIGAVRRVVDRLVTTARSRKHKGALPTWSLNELLFFCQTSGSERTLHVVALRETEGRRVVRVASWGGASTDGRLDLVVKRTVPDLRWSTDAGGPALAVDLGGAGFHAYRYAIRTSDALARRMAEVARDVRDEVIALHEVETDSGPIRTLFRDVRDQLIADLTPERFADVYAQTMVYGLLTARITHPEKFTSVASLAALDFENPFLDAIYARFRSTSDDTLDVDELGLGELAEELAVTDIDEVLADFGAKDQRDDPVVHFYEDFLYRYDSRQRVDLGAFFTPAAVVRYIVRSTDHAIKEAFGLPDGAASTMTWRDYAKVRPDVPRPKQAKPTDRVVSMIDPATGTGTFLVEWLRLVSPTLPAEDALDSMAALEISLASYAVAHLKVSLQVAAGKSTGRLPIYLADTLAPPRPHVFDEMADPVSSEGTLADGVKYEHLHNVVIGNPPYDRVDKDASGGYVLEPHEGGRSLFDDILDLAKLHTVFSHHASLYNLYVYFWRWALWKAFEQQDGPTVVSFITGSSWLTGPGFVGLRQLAREFADVIEVVDLGGNNKGARKEENVFDIETPVAVVTLSRRGASQRNTPAEVRYVRIRGTRAEKLQALSSLVPGGGEPWEPVASSWLGSLTAATGVVSWDSYPALIDLIPWQQPGCKFGRTWPIATASSVLEARWRRLVGTKDLKLRAASFVTPSSGRNIYTAVGGMARIADLPSTASHQPIRRYAYRSFDRQWAFDDPRMAKTESPSLWWSLSSSQVFMATMPTNPLGRGPAVTCAIDVPDLHFFAGRGGKDVLPLYRDAQGTPNADPELLKELTRIHTSGDSSASDVTVERLFAYVYGLLAGSDYTSRFADELETPGPRVPLTADPELFEEMVRHGEHLLWLQTYAERFSAQGRGHRVPRPRALRWATPVTRIPESLKEVDYVEESRQLCIGDGVVGGVAPEVWQFEVSGMQVVRKWLGYRTLKGTGKAASSTSPLDAIRPEAWVEEWNDELLDLLAILGGTLDVLPAGAELLERICQGPLIAAEDLPEPPASLRQPPKSPTSMDRALF
jgi:hypothetical protein